MVLYTLPTLRLEIQQEAPETGEARSRQVPVGP